MACGRSGIIPTEESAATSKPIMKSTSEGMPKPKSKAKALAPTFSYPEGGMSDSSKRRLVESAAGEEIFQYYDDFTLIGEEAAIQSHMPGGSLVPYESEGYAADDPIGSRLAQMVSPVDEQEAIAWTGSYETIFRGSTGVPCPTGMEDLKWGDTINDLPKFKSLQYTYKQMAQAAGSDPDICKYLVWFKKSFGSKGVRQIRMFGVANTQGYVFGAWLLYIGFDRQEVRQSGFTRRVRG